MFAEGLLETAPAGDRTADPRYKRSLMTASSGDRTADTSAQVINLNMNTALKCVPHILRSLQFLQMVAELCADAHYYFAQIFQFPLGKQSFQ